MSEAKEDEKKRAQSAPLLTEEDGGGGGGGGSKAESGMAANGNGAAGAAAQEKTVDEVIAPADADAKAATPTLAAGERVPEENIWISASEGNLADVEQWVTVHGMPVDSKDEWGYVVTALSTPLPPPPPLPHALLCPARISL